MWTSVVTRRSPATKRTIEMKNCDDDENIRVQDDHTLIARIVVKGCPCEKRFNNNATRLAIVSAIVCRQFQTHLQKFYYVRINYPVNVQMLSGNATHTIFDYIVEAPKAEHSRVKNALKQTCKDVQVRNIKMMR